MSFSYNHAQGGEKKYICVEWKKERKKIIKKKKKDEEKERDIQSCIRSLNGLKIERKSMQKLEESC